MKINNLLFLILGFASAIQANPSQKITKLVIAATIATSTGIYALHKIHENTPSEKLPKNQYELALDFIEQRQNSQSSIDSIKANLFDPKFNATINRPAEEDDEDDLSCNDQFCIIPSQHAKYNQDNEKWCSNPSCGIPFKHEEDSCNDYAAYDRYK